MNSERHDNYDCDDFRFITPISRKATNKNYTGVTFAIIAVAICVMVGLRIVL